jgi:hypothetical protein
LTREPFIPIFPPSLAATALELYATLGVGVAPAFPGFDVRIGSEQLWAPRRVYYEPTRLEQVLRETKGDAHVLALCLGSTHWDGWVREECVRQLILHDRPWVAPFIIKLVGEYVVEIIEVIDANLDSVNKQTYANFVRENPNFIATTARRVASYWDCYYRTRYRSLESYPGSIALRKILQMVDLVEARVGN